MVGQKELDHFRTILGETEKDPYSFVLRTKQLPLGLVVESDKQKQMHLLEADPFTQTFGPKAQRNRPKLKVSDMQELAQLAEVKLDGYDDEKDTSIVVESDGIRY